MFITFHTGIKLTKFFEDKSVTIYFRQQNDDINYRYYIFNRVYFHKQAYLPLFNKRID